MLDFMKSVKSPKHRFAWLVAVAADAVQLGLFPFFFPGAASLADDALDLITGAVLIGILGWHWAFLPTLAAELVPGLDLFPTWTAAVFYVTRQRVPPGEPEILPPENPGRR